MRRIFSLFLYEVIWKPTVDNLFLSQRRSQLLISTSPQLTSNSFRFASCNSEIVWRIEDDGLNTDDFLRELLFEMVLLAKV